MSSSENSLLTLRNVLQNRARDAHPSASTSQGWSGQEKDLDKYRVASRQYVLQLAFTTFMLANPDFAPPFFASNLIFMSCVSPTIIQWGQPSPLIDNRFVAANFGVNRKLQMLLHYYGSMIYQLYSRPCWPCVLNCSQRSGLQLQYNGLFISYTINIERVVFSCIYILNTECMSLYPVSTHAKVFSFSVSKCC